MPGTDEFKSIRRVPRLRDAVSRESGVGSQKSDFAAGCRWRAASASRQPANFAPSREILSDRHAMILAVVVTAVFLSSAPATAADPTLHDVIAQTQPKLVKLHGAGGFRGLESYGTGFLVSADGLIATSWGTLLDADPITAVLDDGRRFTAELVGVDSQLGLALLKIDAGGLPYFDLTNAATAGPGDRILAFSNMFRVAAGDEPVSVMHGSILGYTTLQARRGRYDITFEEPVYLIDAVTNNPGAAGGVIISLDGRLLGMIGREVRGTETETWINYALSAPVLREHFQALIDGTQPSDPAMASETAERRPVALGLVLIPNVTTRTPAYVTDVLGETAGQQAGFQRNDLIVFTNGKPTRSIDEFAEQLSRAQPGDRIPIVVRREGRLETLELEVK